MSVNVAHDYDFETIQFVQHAIRLASRDADLAIGGHANAIGICRVALELAADLYGMEGKAYLEHSHLARSEDLGIVVRRMVTTGIESKVIEESNSAFDNLYDLASPPETWAIKW